MWSAAAVAMMPLLTFSTPQQWLNAFQCAGQPQKLPIPIGDLDSHQHMVPLAHMSQPPNGISTGSAVFAWLIFVPNRHTDTQTDSVKRHQCDWPRVTRSLLQMCEALKLCKFHTLKNTAGISYIYTPIRKCAWPTILNEVPKLKDLPRSQAVT